MLIENKYVLKGLQVPTKVCRELLSKTDIPPARVAYLTIHNHPLYLTHKAFYFLQNIHLKLQDIELYKAQRWYSLFIFVSLPQSLGSSR